MLSENGIGSNYHTKDNTPIDYFHDPRVSVEMYPSAFEKTQVSIECPALSYQSGLRSFNTEQEAEMYSRKVYDSLISKLDNLVVERVLNRILF